MSQLLRMRWPKYWSFSFSIIPSKGIPGLISFRMDWLDLLSVQGTLKSLCQHHSSKASILRCSAFFTVQLSHPIHKRNFKLFHFILLASITFSSCVHAKSLQLCPTLCNPVDHSPPIPLSVGFFRQDHRSGLPCPHSGDLSDPGTEAVSLKSPALVGKFFIISSTLVCSFIWLKELGYVVGIHTAMIETGNRNLTGMVHGHQGLKDDLDPRQIY